MYTILLKDTNELITTKKERIMQKSKLVDKLRFLVPIEYKDFNMSDFTATLEYLAPVSKTYRTELLTALEDLYTYKDYECLQYVLPFDTNLTAEIGDVEIQITFTNAEMDDDGKVQQYVRKTMVCKITITPITAWSDYISDSALTSLDERLVKMDAMMKELNELADVIDQTKADNLALEDNRLFLTANGEKISNDVLVAVPRIDESTVDPNVDGIIEI